MTFAHAAACRRAILVATTFLLLGVPSRDLHAAPPDPTSRRPGPRYVADEILVAFKADARPDEVQAVLRDLGAKRMRPFKRTRVERHKIGRPVEEAVERYKGHRAIQFIEPNYVLTAEVLPNDPSFPLQWSLRNTGQQSETPGADIDAALAWDHRPDPPR